MSASVLGSLSLGYQLLWERARRPAAVRLFISAETDTPVDARHLLATLDELWPMQAPRLLLSVQSLPLLLDLLEHGDASTPWLEVPAAWFTNSTVAARVEASRARDLPLIWSAQANEPPPPELAFWFHKGLLKLSAGEALACLAVSRRQDAGGQTCPSPASPAQSDQMYRDVPSLALARHCLDQQLVWALAGWPDEDALQAGAGAPVPPSRRQIERLLTAIDADAAIDTLEHLLDDDPVLLCRFLEFANSPELGLRHEVESVRQGLMVLGLTQLQTWLRRQRPQADDAPDLQPVRINRLMRAHLMERLLEAGEEHKLRGEVYLCGLLADIEPLLGEPLTALLDRLPLSWRIRHALLQREGPYVPYLDIAAALGSPDTQAARELCEVHELDMEDVNRALLRALAGVTSPATGQRY